MLTPEKITIFNIDFDIVSIKETIDFADQCIISQKKCNITVVNTASVVYAQKNELMLNAINNSTITTIDGMPIVWTLRMLGYKIPGRVCGPDIYDNLIDLAVVKGYKPYFLGATPEVIEKMVSIYKNKYPNLNIAGYRNGFFTENEEQDIVDQIKASNADMLFIGMSSPKKEVFLKKYFDYMDVPISMGVGGVFDIIAGKTNRAPVWMQKSGFEWFYRILQEPRRMMMRYAYTNSVFIWMAVKEIFGRLFH